ncbi:SDR family NAD(P)-dependent oxidoreductase [Nafulsella turpanensis]|uniref:SDR family NAD(P)-dependent oxidoreductase n=1 Tax=Nafulsella turpanensis TaxID=1265690 RepID=UPI00034D5281|nr:SDR family NAD(P)-dependent oxidoreductase [Nafulsella turpanensis]
MKRAEKEGQVMVITGATSGIGRAMAVEWARQGGSVVLAARSKEILEEVASVCIEAGGKASLVQADVSNEKEVNNIAEEAIRAFGKIDVWLNNAAVMVFGSFNDIPTEDVLKIVNTNLLGVIYGARVALKHFRSRAKGILINMGSIAGIVGQPYSVPYSISKAGIRALGIALGQELENEKNIHVCTVLPSIIDTPIYQHAANYSGNSINPPTSATPVEKVVEAILKLTAKPTKEVFVGKRNQAIRLGRSMAPGFFDKIYQKSLDTIELTDPPTPSGKGNLYEPMPWLAGTSGGWLEKEKKGKRLTFKSIAGKTAITAGIIIGTAWLFSKA